MKVMSSCQKLEPENNPEIGAQETQKQLTREVKSTTYAQNQTLITQTHTGIKKQIRRLKCFN